jgi:hypothetical protein
MKYGFAFLMFLIVFAPLFASAIELNLNYPNFGDFNLADGQELAQVVAFFYYLFIGIAGLAAFVMLVWGGVQWLVSGAAPGQAGEARDKIRNAIIGLLLILASFLIIQVINPELIIIGSGDPSLVGKSSGKEKVTFIDSAAFKTAFTVNGGKTATVSSGDSVLLEWRIDPVFTSCNGASSPAGLWNRSIEPDNYNDSETVGPITEMPTFLTLICNPPSGSEMATVLSIGIDPGGSPAPLPLVDLKVDPDRDGPLPPSDGPLSLPDGTAIDVILFSKNATQCWGGPRTAIKGQTQLKFLRTVQFPPPQDIFDVVCYNNTGQSARDEVIVNVLPL